MNRCTCGTPDNGTIEATADGRWRAVCDWCNGDATEAMAAKYEIPTEADAETAARIMFDAVLKGA